MSIAAQLTPAHQGVGYMTLATGWWMGLPVYWTWLGPTDAVLNVAYLVPTALAFLAVVLTVRGGWPAYGALWRTPRRLGGLAVTAVLIAGNWLLYVLAVEVEQIIQIGLGFLINPLFAILLGRFVLNEPLTRNQAIAAAIVVAAILVQVFASGEPPWIALGIGLSVAVYGLIRKQMPVEPAVGITLEVTLMLPFALAALWWLDAGLPPHPGLWLCGMATVVPLLWFVAAAHRLRYATVGVAQFFAPTGNVLVAVLAFGEPFHEHDAVTFGLIALAVCLYIADAVRARPT